MAKQEKKIMMIAMALGMWQKKGWMSNGRMETRSRRERRGHVQTKEHGTTPQTCAFNITTSWSARRRGQNNEGVTKSESRRVSFFFFFFLIFFFFFLRAASRPHCSLLSYSHLHTCRRTNVCALLQMYKWAVAILRVLPLPLACGIAFILTKCTEIHNHR
uniref:Uncharacterized protein n=1 Tax=Trypanosoma vivax (strain Y486) TaxID=1055687 RepID=G0UBB1_TRYVY|nr:hypothetical protein, unlikely [Trypanosoma vivax Y486]